MICLYYPNRMQCFESDQIRRCEEEYVHLFPSGKLINHILKSYGMYMYMSYFDVFLLWGSVHMWVDPRGRIFGVTLHNLKKSAHHCFAIKVGCSKWTCRPVHNLLRYSSSLSLLMVIIISVLYQVVLLRELWALFTTYVISPPTFGMREIFRWIFCVLNVQKAF